MTGCPVLLVDDDLGFVFWLGQHLDSAGLLALPAKNTADAFSLMTDHRVVPGVVVVNAALEHAAELIAYARRLRPSVKVVGVVPEEAREGLPPMDAIRSRPVDFTQDTGLEWVRFLQSMARAACDENR